MKKLLTLFIIFIGLFIASASAQESELTETIGDIELEINEKGIVTVTQDMELMANTEVYLAEITIPKAKADSVKIFDLDSNYALEHDSIPLVDEEIINYYFPEPLGAGENKKIKIKYSTDFFTSKEGDTWELSFYLKTSNKSTVKIMFPENVIISFTSSAVIPSTYIENGKQVLELKPDAEEFDFLCEYKFKKTRETKEPEEPEEPNVSNFMLIIFIIIIFIVALMYYFKFKKPAQPIEKIEEEKELEKEKRIKPSIFKILDENEKKIVKILQSSDDEVTQAYIHKSTKIPRSTLSKIIFRLEERNIIERRREGKTNWIRLKKWVFG